MKEEFFIERAGRKMVLFAGLLDLAHENGLRHIDTDLLQVPSKENADVAIVKAVVEMEDGRRFTGIGDAGPHNVGKMIQAHTIRMAETRAKARALRDATNIGVTAFEEMGEEEAPQSQSQSRTSQPRASGGKATDVPLHTRWLIDKVQAGHVQIEKPPSEYSVEEVREMRAKYDKAQKGTG